LVKAEALRRYPDAPPPAPAEKRWIPITEKVGPIGEWEPVKLVVLEGEEGPFVTTAAFDEADHRWYTGGIGDPSHEIEPTHWMDMPEPPVVEAPEEGTP
jgi:hypothetical protein